MDVKEFAEKFIKAEDEAWQNGNFNALEALEDPNVVYHSMTRGEDLVGWEAHKQLILGNRQITSELHQDWKYIAGDGNVFSLSYKSRAKYAVEVPPLSIPAGATAVVDGLFVFRLNGGKVAEAWYQSSASVQ
ncbi:MAG: nuclear transport factor 2 family protein [Dehalococcoidales bacterium]|nr:MAG: nuclear transport factor 2 family protein [Dehalococcoidales bacterium]